MASMQISNETMEKWNVDEKELLAIAMMNMKKHLSGKISFNTECAFRRRNCCR